MTETTRDRLIWVEISAADGDAITAHLSSPGTLTGAMDRVSASGDEVLSETISIPSAAFFYAKDTEGNSLGIVRHYD